MENSVELSVSSVTKSSPKRNRPNLSIIIPSNEFNLNHELSVESNLDDHSPIELNSTDNLNLNSNLNSRIAYQRLCMYLIFITICCAVGVFLIIYGLYQKYDVDIYNENQLTMTEQLLNVDTQLCQQGHICLNSTCQGIVGHLGIVVKTNQPIITSNVTIECCLNDLICLNNIHHNFTQIEKLVNFDTRDPFHTYQFISRRKSQTNNWLFIIFGAICLGCTIIGSSIKAFLYDARQRSN